MVGADNPRPLHAPLLQSMEGGEKVGDVLLLFSQNAPLPRLRSLFDEAPGVLRQGGTHIIPDVKPLRMPPLVGG